MSAATLRRSCASAGHFYKPVRLHDLLRCWRRRVRAAAFALLRGSWGGDGPQIAVPRRPLRVLIVEDTLTNQVVARIMVEKLGHQCRSFQTGWRRWN
jgi:hypothetical protein